MYVRRRVNKSGTTSVFLIASHRVDGKKHPQCTVIKSYGSSSDAMEVERLVLEAEAYKARLEKENFSAKATIKIQAGDDIKQCLVKKIGPTLVYRALFERYFSGLNIKKLKDLSTLRDLAVMRIIKPVSKRRTIMIGGDYGIEGLGHNQVYREMDKLNDEAIEAIKKCVYKNTVKMLGGEDKLHVLFYDLTTLYFEADSKSDLKAHGYSKDGKRQHVQVTLVMVVTEQGLPVDYQLLKGNTYEGNTLIPVLAQLQKKYAIQKITLVADSALLSKANLKALEEGGYRYIVAARVKNMTTNLTNRMLNKEGYQALNSDVRYKEIERDKQGGKRSDERAEIDKKERLIVCHSEQRRRKDGYHRDEIVAKIKKAGNSIKGKFSSLYKQSYMKITEDATIALDEEKLKEASRFDGYRGYWTNTDLPAEEVISQYRGLWQVEQTFRITKHNLSVRPIYHYTDRRIKAHFAICFMSLSIVRYVEYLLKAGRSHTPIEQLNHLLGGIHQVELRVGQISSRMTTDITKEAKTIFNILSIPIPKRLTISAAP